MKLFGVKEFYEYKMCNIQHTIYEGRWQVNLLHQTYEKVWNVNIGMYFKHF